MVIEQGEQGAWSGERAHARPGVGNNTDLTALLTPQSIPLGTRWKIQRALKKTAL